MSTALEPVPAQGLFGADPAGVVATARDIAGRLNAVLRERGLVKRISGREFVLVEGWTLLGSMVGVFADVEWTHPLMLTGPDGITAPYGYEARAVAMTVDGRRISSAEAMCARDEPAWRNRNDYALRSMAQTRAVSKALRLPLGFIVELAGYSATPAEEVPTRAVPEPEADTRTRAGLRAAIGAAALEADISADDLAGMAREAGVTGRATLAQLRVILERIRANGLPDIPEVESSNDDAHGNGKPDSDPD